LNCIEALADFKPYEAPTFAFWSTLGPSSNTNLVYHLGSRRCQKCYLHITSFTRS